MLESTSAGFFAKVSASSERMTSRSRSINAASAPAYMMFFISVRARAPSKFSLHSCANGTPKVRMSSRANRLLRGQVES
jgi:hypothetical protein